MTGQLRLTRIAGLWIGVLILAAGCRGTAVETDTPDALKSPAPTETAAATATVTATTTQTPTSTPTPTETPGPGLGMLLGTPQTQYLNADLEGAKAQYAALAELYPQRAAPLMGLADVAQREGDIEAAVGYLQAATEAEPTIYDAWRQLAVLQDQRGEHAEAAAAYGKMIELVPDEADLYVARGTSRARVGDADGAIEDLEAAQALDPYLQYAWLNVAGAAYGARQYETATRIVDRGLEVYPEAAGMMVTRGLARLALGDNESAVDHFDAALAIDGRLYAAHRWRGYALEKLGRDEEALEAYQRAGELGVAAGALGREEGYEAMAYAAQVIARDDPQAAFAYLAEQVILHGQPPPLLMGYALIDIERERLSTAQTRLDGIISLYGYLPAYYWRGVILAELGEDELAAADLEMFLSVQKAGPRAEEARQLLEELSG